MTKSMIVAGFWLSSGLLCCVASLGFGQNAISTGTRAGFRMYYPNSNDWWLDPSKGSFDIRANGGSPFVTLSALGNLGIGTTDPAAKLHVAGDVFAEGRVIGNAGGGWFQNVQIGTAGLGNSTIKGSGGRLNLQNSLSEALLLESAPGTTSSPVMQFNAQPSAAGHLFDWQKSGVSQMRMDGSGNVGIGTANPAAKLEVAGGSGRFSGLANPASGVGVEVAFDGANGVVQPYDRTNNAYKPLYLNASSLLVNTGGGTGNVGVGTTSPAAKLNVSGNILATGDISGATINGGTPLMSPMSSTLNINATPALATNQPGIQVSTNFFVMGGGNVGIGTTAPQTKLDVFGAVNANSPNGFGLGMTPANPNGDGFFYYAGTGQFGLNANADLRLFTNATERMRITSGGNVGIGTASPSLAKLQVDNSGAGALTAYFTGTSNTAVALNTDGTAGAVGAYHAFKRGGTNKFLVGLGPISGADVYEIGTAAAALITVQSGGNVGIGTASPSLAKLQVDNSGAGALTAYFTGTSNTAVALNTDGSAGAVGAYHAFKRGGTNKFLVGLGPISGADVYEIGTAAAALITVQSGGNVGIGTGNPTTGKLVVSGGNLDMTGNRIINLPAALPTAATDAATKAYVDASIGGKTTFAGQTGTPYQGGALGGYPGANTKCQAEFAGSHFCSIQEYRATGDTGARTCWINDDSITIWNYGSVYWNCSTSYGTNAWNSTSYDGYQLISGQVSYAGCTDVKSLCCCK